MINNYLIGLSNGNNWNFEKLNCKYCINFFGNLRIHGRWGVIHRYEKKKIFDNIIYLYNWYSKQF